MDGAPCEGGALPQRFPRMKAENLSDGEREIDGLRFEELWSIPNGEDSYVIPIATLRPTNIVFKGDAPFSFGHFGAHLGQEDRLVFLGPKDNTITAFFLDCRASATSYKVRMEIKFAPSSTRLLVIPPGVAHAFDTVATTTLNLYRMFIPEPSEWLSGRSKWTVAGDIVNVGHDVADEDVPDFVPNSHAASEVFYQLIADQQRQDLAGLKHEYPVTHEFSLADGQSTELKLWKRLGDRPIPPDWEPIEGIEGAGWRGNLVVWTGERSGYVPLLDARPRHLIDHGEKQEYTHDAFGIHIGGVDHLTFIGPTTLQASIELVDCRRGSPSLHNSVKFSFSPNPLRTLVIPQGVAHRFEHMEGIYTINQPLTYLPAEGVNYQPGNDVLDWPIDKRPFPILEIYTAPADVSYYRALVSAQQSMTASPPTHSTPSIMQSHDAEGKPVTVAIRKRLA